MNKKTAVIAISSLGAVIILLLCLFIPLAIDWYQKTMLTWEIQKIEKKIDKNKAEWTKCATNMQLWNSDNDKNRAMVADLKEQYNKMVGFTTAGQE